MTGTKLDLCARAYLEYYRSQFKKYSWANDYADQLIQADPYKGLEFVGELLSICRDEEEISYIAAGIFEELLHRYFNVIQQEIMDHLQFDKAMRWAIRYVWAPDKSPLGLFLNDMQVKFGDTNKEKNVFDFKGYKPRI